ncbi:hypothetical protein [Nonomuraea insulae]|uniref:Uncharacterized protein n=1 Tax=Nonomuraea insulae TaxID=1616787 RepID=A0ABW1DCM4_9ACTN
MATENSGPHLPSSWPEAPRRDAAPSWQDSPSAEVPTAWPETPGAAHPEPSWPEPPRKDASWPDLPGSDPLGGPPPARQDPLGGPAPWSGAPAPGASWPEPTRQDAGWPDSARQDAPRHDTGRHDPLGQDISRHDPLGQDTGRHDIPRHDPLGQGASRADVPMSWPESGPRDVPATWSDSSPQGVPTSWPDAPPPPQSTAAPTSWPDVSSKGSPAPGRPADPVPAWEQPPTPSPDAWSNLASPAPWPPGDTAAERTMMYSNQSAPPQDLPPPPPPQQAHPADERTVTYGQHTENVLNDRAVPSAPADSAHVGAPPPAEEQAGRRGSNLSRDPSDPENRFVTAGQISGSRTPPPERQQELWNTVFGDDYHTMGDQDDLDEDAGRPIWIYALGGSVVVALVVALLWAFLWGPLAGGEDPTSASASSESTAPPAEKPSATKTSTTIGPLPKYPGKAAAVIGRVPDAGARISVPRLGGTWRLDQRATVKATWGFDTRQYVQVAPERYAEIMSGPLSPKLSSYYEQDNLEPTIKQVVLNARRNYFPADNKVRKIAQQAIKVGDQTGRLIAYSLTSETEKATIVTIAVNTGANVPAIIYMSIPSESKQLLPDVRTVMNQIRIG